MYIHKYAFNSYLETSLERQLKLTSLDNNVREIQEMDLQRIQHAFPCDNDLLRLFLYRQGSDQGSYLLGGLPLGKLQKHKYRDWYADIIYILFHL